MFDSNKIDELNSSLKKLETSLSNLESRLLTSNSDTFLTRMDIQMKKTIATIGRLQDEYKDLSNQLEQTHLKEMRAMWEKRKGLSQERDIIRDQIKDLRQESELRKFVGEYKANPKAYDQVQKRLKKLEAQEAKAELRMRKEIEKLDKLAIRNIEAHNKRKEMAIALTERLGKAKARAEESENTIAQQRAKNQGIQQQKARNGIFNAAGFGGGGGVIANGMQNVMNFGGAMQNAVKHLGLFNTSILGFSALLASLAVRFGMYRIEDKLSAYGSLRKSGLGTEISDSLAKGTEGARNEALQKYGVNLNRQQAAEIQSGVTNSLGGASLATQGFVASIGNLTKGYYASTEASTRFASALLRNNKFSEQAAINALNLVEKFGVGSGVSVAKLTETLAANTDLLARSTDKTGESLIRAAINADRLGVSLNSFEGLANRLVDDFESSLTRQAELQTFLPGMDLSETMFASQFGSSEQIQNALQKALRDTGLGDTSQIPRSLQNRLSSSLGMSLTDINNILGGSGVTSPIGQTDSGTQGMQKFAKEIDTSVMNLGAFINGALDYAARKLFLGADGTSSGGGSSVYQRGSSVRHNGGMVNGSVMGNRSVSASAFSGAPRFHDGLMPDEVPTILQMGEAVLSKSQLMGLTNLVNTSVVLGELGSSVVSGGATNISSNDMVQKFSSFMNNESNTTTVANNGTGNIEHKLDELISAFKNMGISIDLDGKKVGHGLVEAFSRGA